ncbi:protein-methionine-sulfoxide reductase heme-binding subunit MsrQ [Szabonella alba]|uniref:Protein-methionine-sulfoxide reductase heme-binding subunit MsrQ n=1 Tax=Szabonella alba TaxID=2804194 RepID=A0A8K0Y055_9RHOB|nr:protein-methionine-sulfoxide reductase heme-binding subunit MsrQ [Szabonella alba]MBL4916472.1 protein-methionine-sulfoxide reductase heme-binding subunit MsrQ [Szabonella alba]
MLVDRLNGWARRISPNWLYAAAVIPVLWLVWQLNTGALGVDPVKRIEHSLGLWGLQMIVAGLCITPLRRLAGVNLLRFRRAVGLIAFAYVTLHLTVWLLLDLQLRWGQIWGDILKRPYITVGMAGFALMLPLALTSNAASIRRLGAAGWQKLHRITYLAALAGVIHYIWLVRTWQAEPILYFLAVIGLILLRVLWSARSRRARTAPVA